jgi:hypothetical protein
MKDFTTELNHVVQGFVGQITEFAHTLEAAHEA